MSDREAIVRIKFAAAERDKFKALCALNQTNMSEQIIKLIVHQNRTGKLIEVPDYPDDDS